MDLFYHSTRAFFKAPMPANKNFLVGKKKFWGFY